MTACGPRMLSTSATRRPGERKGARAQGWSVGALRRENRVVLEKIERAPSFEHCGCCSFAYKASRHAPQGPLQTDMFFPPARCVAITRPGVPTPLAVNLHIVVAQAP